MVPLTVHSIFLTTFSLRETKPSSQSVKPPAPYVRPYCESECSVRTAVLRLLDRAQRPHNHTHTDEPRGRSFTQPATSQVVGPPQTSPQADHVRRSVPGEQYPDSTAIVLFPKGLGMRIVASRVQYLGNTCCIVRVGCALEYVDRFFCQHLFCWLS